MKCNHTAHQARKDFGRQCNICGHIDSATSNTLFHNIKFGIRKAFFICFEMTTNTKSLSARYTAVRYGITEKTARLFMLKVREAMASICSREAENKEDWKELCWNEKKDSNRDTINRRW